MVMENYWQRLVNSGWIKDMPETEQEELRLKIDQCVRDDQNPIAALHDISAIQIDVNGAGLDGQGLGVDAGEKMIRECAEHSFGKFEPSEIVAEMDTEHETVKLGFTHHQTHFEKEVPWKDDSKWLQEEVKDLVNQALEADGTEQRFMDLPATADHPNNGVVFVSENAYEKAVEAGLLSENANQVQGAPLDGHISSGLQTGINPVGNSGIVGPQFNGG